jgi:tetraacyldisaccharide 4'-kinase
MRHWLDRNWLAWLLLPLSALAWLVLWCRQAAKRLTPPNTLPVPVVVVGNLLAGSTGKTPVVVALVRALGAGGLAVGVVSRGYGRSTGAVMPVAPHSSAASVGDEPLLIQRLTGVPVFVGARRHDAALALLAAHPAVQVIVSDDGLQHDALPRAFNIAVFDERGAGNGWLLPAGPLRQPLTGALAPHLDAVLYNASIASTTLAGHVLVPEQGKPVPLQQWAHGDTDGGDLPQGRLLAAAGIGQPERFFRGLTQQGLSHTPMPLPDHAPLTPPPWTAVDWDAVLVTEKDAVKLDPGAPGNARVWVVPHRVGLPASVVRQVLDTVRAHGRTSP